MLAPMSLASTAARHEAGLLWASRPSLYALLRAGRLLGPVARLPRLGWVVTDAVTARRVLGRPRALRAAGRGRGRPPVGAGPRRLGRAPLRRPRPRRPARAGSRPVHRGRRRRAGRAR